MTVYAQFFCSIADLIADAQAPGVDETRMMQAIREASEYVQKKIGWFVPVTLSLSFPGTGTDRMFVPPLLAITSITNDGTALTSADYFLTPKNGYWANGPYDQIVRDPDSSLLAVWNPEKNAVVIAGRWGKYERSASTGATVQDAPQSNSQTTLKVSNGGLVSPGMVLLVESEQEAVTGWESPTTNVTLLNGAITATDDVLTLDDGTLVNTGEILRLDFEQMRVKDKRTNQVHVTRGWNNTGQVTHADNTQVDVYRTATVTRGVNGTTAASHAQNTAIDRYFAPDDIQYLTKQIATLIVSKAKSGYQGRTGDAELGTVFYHDVFTREIDQVRQQYMMFTTD